MFCASIRIFSRRPFAIWMWSDYRSGLAGCIFFHGCPCQFPTSLHLLFLCWISDLCAAPSFPPPQPHWKIAKEEASNWLLAFQLQSLLLMVGTCPIFCSLESPCTQIYNNHNHQCNIFNVLYSFFSYLLVKVAYMMQNMEIYTLV